MNQVKVNASRETELRFDPQDLPTEVFELAEQGLTIESLTAGHGLVENGASFPSCGSSCSSLP